LSISTPELWYIQKLALTKQLSKQVLETLTQEARLERWGHAAVLEQQRKLDQVYMVLSGHVKVVSSAVSGGSWKLAPGDLFGPLKELDTSVDDPQMFLQAVDPVTLAVLPRERFESLVLPHVSKVSFATTRLPRPRVMSNSSVSLPLGSLLYTPPVVRLAKSLICWAEERKSLRDDSSQVVLPISPNAQTLSRAMGLDKSSMEQPLRAFLTRELILPAQKKIIVPDLEPLQRAAQGHSLF